MDIVAPEVPKLEKKQGFFKKLFSHKPTPAKEQKIEKPLIDNNFIEEVRNKIKSGTPTKQNTEEGSFAGFKTMIT